MLGSGSNSTCSECMHEVPVGYCMCKGESFFLCSSCISAHNSKFPQLFHALMPVGIDSKDIPTYLLHVKQVAEGKAELQRNLDAIDSCCNELSAAVDTLTEQLTQLRDQWLQQLGMWKSQLKQEFDKTIEEVEKTMHVDSPVFTAKYSQALRNYQSGQFAIFTYQIDMSGIKSGFESFVKANLSDAAELQPPPAQEQQREIAQYQQAAAYFYDQSEQQVPQSLFEQRYSTMEAYPSPSSYQMFTEVVNSPETFSPYGYEQFPAPGSSQSFQMLGTSTCPACNKPFLNEGGKRVYCSVTCNPNNPKVVSLPPTGNYKQCASCKALLVGRYFPIPSDLQEYVSFASSVCSLDCMRKFKEIATGVQVSCSGCGSMREKQSFVLQLQCGHGFHSKDCLFGYLIETTRAFTYSTQLSCKQCHQQFEFGLVFQAINKGEFANRQKELMKLVCSTCGSYNIRRNKLCRHYTCDEHRWHSCYFCFPCYKV